MKIGIVSDSHGLVDRLRLALDMFASRGVQAVVHCGDLGTQACLEALAEPGVPAYAVGGNVDVEVGNPDDSGAGLFRPTEVAGVTFAWESVTFPVAAGTSVAVTHGHDPLVFARLVNDHANQFLLHGHTHRQRNECLEREGSAGPVYIINPGALNKPRTPDHPTVAVLDTENDTVEFIAVE